MRVQEMASRHIHANFKEDRSSGGDWVTKVGGCCRGREKKDPMKTDKEERKMKVHDICQMDQQKCHEKSMQEEQEKKLINLRSKIKFKPKLDVVTEAEGNCNDPELRKLSSAGKMESETAVVDKTAAAQNCSEMSSKKTENSCKLSSAGETETASTIVDKTTAAENSGEMSSEKSENS
ncbi:hypothetical protein AVEN_218072-1 [Araneus ventricosus]|uniref:Uncharacterized protein n=1 Tax=Araneus ventricosus TaxID=182803 RepID=A0A4Y2HPG7_ARAVE|nr:hypothetical protein AVEN_218072-1 [Araneus ventricosus]